MNAKILEALTIQDNIYHERVSALMLQAIQIHLIENDSGYTAYSPNLLACPTQVQGGTREEAVAAWKAEFARVVKRALGGENIPQMNMVKRGITKPEDYRFHVFERLNMGQEPLEL